MDTVATITALLAGIAAAVATIVTSIKKVGEGNYVTVTNRLGISERNLRRSNLVVDFLTDWQLDAKQLHRLQANAIIEAGGTLTPEMLALHERLRKEMTLEELIADDGSEDTEPRTRGRHRGSV